jgi:hypothetical protein
MFIKNKLLDKLLNDWLDEWKKEMPERWLERFGEQVPQKWLDKFKKVSITWVEDLIDTREAIFDFCRVA